MNLYLIIHYIIILMSIYLIIFKNNKVNEIIILLVSSFDSIPILYFGNSASGGIFLADIILILLIIKSIIYKRKLIKNSVNIKMMPIALIFISWIILCSILSMFREIPVETIYTATSSYIKFTIYGLIRMISYIIYMFVFNNYYLEGKEKDQLLVNLFKIFVLFCILLALNQKGILNLSGIESLGSRVQKNMQVLNQDLNSQIFLGTNKPNLGAICYTIIWFFIYYQFKKDKFDFKTVISTILSIIVLLGTQSRSDVVALIVSIIAFVFITNTRARKLVLKILSVVIYLCLMLICVSILFDISLGREGIDYYINSIIFMKKGVGSAGYRMLLHEAIIKYLNNNPLIMILGLGPNCFRMLYGLENITTNFGHNTYLHIIAELGIIGISIMSIFYLKLIKEIKRKIYIESDFNISYSCILAFFVGRMACGVSVDTFFAVDTMLSSNIMVFAYISIVYITSYNVDLQRIDIRKTNLSLKLD